MSTMNKRNLLLCFDAFGTLFTPKSSVARQYVQVASQCGITSLTQDELQPHLLAAIHQERRRNPNYGKDTGLGATRWWTNVIQATFKPLIPDGQPLPPTLVPELMRRFASSQGYDAVPNLIPTIRAFRQEKARRGFEQLVIGVVSNSDDRVPGILSSFGLSVSPLRYGTPGAPPEKEYDIDFHCMSYDVGVEKPDARIFRAAETMLSRVIAGRAGRAPSPAELGRWQKVHVGDEYAKDVVGAARAGWKPVLLDVGDEFSHVPTLGDWPPESETMFMVDTVQGGIHLDAKLQDFISKLPDETHRLLSIGCKVEGIEVLQCGEFVVNEYPEIVFKTGYYRKGLIEEQWKRVKEAAESPTEKQLGPVVAPQSMFRLGDGSVVIAEERLSSDPDRQHQEV
ncbi:haloacid dehalogenase [Metarhizium album ARSEF 1941]|uniref:Haloacid dehalogenase n=1 Tax=Metarhizium album (strain ARSEF 1941) TaxID=1081103 RepID=A0A0B2X1X4_METAS|nr:haloacid dehalogenase [Metarhizium album ARSEF 1941]KHN99732.1 haloacid dehalogenase [Metarhizium album ARSEF 1941]